MSKNTEASIKNLEIQIGRLSIELAEQPSSSGFFGGNTIDNLKNDSCKDIMLKNRVVPLVSSASCERKEVSEGEKKGQEEEVVEKVVEKNQTEKKVRNQVKTLLWGYS